jgi:O-antigen/teichoic acid export membrane protein
MIGIRRALLLTTTERYFTLAVNFITIAAVSRLLTPAEIGVAVVGTSVAALAFSAREFATGTFLIQQPMLTREDIRGAFTVMLALSLIIAGTIVLGAPWAAALYNEERLTIYLHVIAASFLLELFSAPIISLLQRELEFQKVALLNATNTILLATGTIGLAVSGHSYMSFAWAGLASTACSGLLAIFLWRDLSIFRPLLGRWRGMLRFGGYNGSSVLLYRIYELLPYLVLGRILSIDSTALYNRAMMICQIPDKLILGGAASVVLPALAWQTRSGRSLKEPYLRAVEYITGLQWPALLVLSLLAEPAVQITLGEQWLEIVPIVQIIAIASLFSFTSLLNHPVLLAVDALRDTFFRALIAWPASAIIITVAALFGLKAIAFSYFIIIPFQAVTSLYFVRKHVPITWSDFVQPLKKSAVVAASSCIGPASVVFVFGDQWHISTELALGAGVLSVLGWIGGLWWTCHPLLHEIERGILMVRTSRIGRRTFGTTPAPSE